MLMFSEAFTLWQHSGLTENIPNYRHAKCTEQAERCSGKFLLGWVNFWSEYTRFFVANGKHIIQYALPSCEG